MKERNIRIGRVSKIDYDHGMMEVTYPDLDDSVSDAFPVFSMCNEYKMPNIGEEVLVLHFSNGESAGVVLGRYWNEENTPAVTGVDVFRKELGDSFGEAYMQYMNNDITFHYPEETTTVRDILRRLTELERRVDDHENRISVLEGIHGI